MSAFDRVNVIVEGEKLDARPIEFKYDCSNNVEKAILWETTCPKCGGLVQFNELQECIDGTFYVNCSDCSNVPDEPLVEVNIQSAPEQIEIRDNGQKIQRMKNESVVYKCPFIEVEDFDPVFIGEK